MPPLEKNTRLIIGLLAGAAAGLTRSELEERSELSPPTVRSVLDELEAEGRVEIVKDPSRSPRRPDRILLASQGDLVVGADQGHRHLRIGIADRSGAVLRYAQKDPYDVDELGPAALVAIASLINDKLKEIGREPRDVGAVCLGMPAPLTADGKTASPLLPDWANLDIAAEFRQVLVNSATGWSSSVPIAVENDANLGAVGVRRPGGPAEGLDNFAYIKVSTGIGCGLFLGGVLYRGNAAAGELGHVTAAMNGDEQIRAGSALAPPTRECAACTKLNCLENVASCRAIVEQLKRTNAEYPEGLDVRKVIENGRNDPIGHPHCRRAIVDAGARIGSAIADLAWTLNPQLVVVGGVLAGAEELVLDAIEDAVERASIGGSGVPVKLVPVGEILETEVHGAVDRAIEVLTESVS